VADVARRHGTTRWQVYDWRKKLRTGQLVVPKSVAALPMFAEPVLEDTAAPIVGEKCGLKNSRRFSRSGLFQGNRPSADIGVFSEKYWLTI